MSTKKTAFEVYLSVVYRWGILLLVSSCTLASFTYVGIKAFGLLTSIPWSYIIFFVCMDIILFVIANLLIKSALSDGYLKEGKLRTGKIFSVIVLFIQWNYVLYFFPSSIFWGFFAFLLVLLGFF